MRLSSRFVLPLALIVRLASPLLAAEPMAAEPPKSFDIKAIDEYLASQVKAKSFVGLSVAVMRDGKVVLVRGYGKTSLKTGAEVGPDTLFAAGSVTKQFTCACILLLAEEGKLSTRDKVAKYFPRLTSAGDITLYDLMTHVSGYPDYYPLDFVDRRLARAIDPDKLIQEYAGGKLDFEPATRFSYSNTGYVILGRVIEKVTGTPFGAFLAERIFKPLGMEHSVFAPKPDAKNQATGYTAFALGAAEPAPPEAEGWIHAAGGIYTTPSDLLKWDLALMEGKLLKAESFQLMSEPRKLADGRKSYYGCGQAILQRDGEVILRHSGAVSGFLAFNTMIPRTKSALALMTNSEHLDAGSINDALSVLLIKAGAPKAPAIPKVKGPAAKDAALDLLHQLQSGKVQRDNLGEEFSLYLSPQRVGEAKDRLKALGEPEKVEVESTSERGGMEVTGIRFTFKTRKVKASLYRTPDGKIQQFLLYKS